MTYFHKSEPSPEGDDFTECHPWKNNACCHEASVVTTPKHLNTMYGHEYRWDRCGKLSEACERFFVAENCFYECDVNLGHFRTFSDAEVEACTDDWCDGNYWSTRSRSRPRTATRSTRRASMTPSTRGDHQRAPQAHHRVRVNV